MGDDVTGRPPPAARYIGGGDVPRRPEDEAVLVQALPGGEAIARLRFPGRFVQLQREMEMLRRLPYMFRRLDLTAAGTKEIDFEGNYLAVMRIAGAVAEGAELRVKFNTEGREWISIQSEIILPMSFDKVYLA
ncbi:hypothetical protein LCGC14_1898550, partial [marine sediment metagenome]